MVSIIAPVANLFVLPTIPLAMLLSFTTGLVGVMAPHWMAAWLALPATGLLALDVAAAQWFAGLPYASTQLTLTGPMVAGFYGLILVWSGVMWRRRGGFARELESRHAAGLHT
jgi:hypothetical protein